MRRGNFTEALIPCTPTPNDMTCLSNGVRGLTRSGVLAVDPLGRPVPQNAIYDPRTTRLAANGSIIRDPLLNNSIPPELMDRTALTIQSMIPLPTNNDVVN